MTSHLDLSYVVGLDLGQARDYSALVVLEREVVSMPYGEDGHLLRSPIRLDPEYRARHLQRWPLGTAYTTIARDVAALLDRPPLRRGDTVLATDQTGVGRAVIDVLRAAGLEPLCITITGGDAVTSDSDGRRVPKRDLISTIEVLLQQGRLKIAPELPETPTLIRELDVFRRKLSPAGHDSYGVWREGEHDDLVLAVALALWAAEHGSGTIEPLDPELVAEYMGWADRLYR